MSKKWVSIGCFIVFLGLVSCAKSTADEQIKNVKDQSSKSVKSENVLKKYQADAPLKIKTPDDIGKQLQSILRQYRMLTRSQFKSYFLDYGEIARLKNSDFLALTEKEKQQAFFQVPKLTYQSGLEKEYIKVYSGLQKYKIDSDKLTFEDFVYQENKKTKPNLVSGVLIFISKGKKYGLDSISVKTGPNRYQLISIGPEILK